MTDDDRKMLTELIGEEWHEHKGDGSIECSCGYIPCYLNRDARRDMVRLYAHFKEMNDFTFSTWSDLGAVMDALVKKGWWEAFYWFALDRASEIVDSPPFAAWLIRPINEEDEPHFCQLVADFMKEGK